MGKKYDSIKKKFGLPSLKKIEEIFEISVKDNHLVIQNIRNEIGYKLYEISKTIESIIFTSEASDPEILYEVEMIKDRLMDCYELYKELNYIYFKSLRLKYEHNQKSDVEYIKEVLKAWPQMEKKIREIFEIIEKGWKNFKFTPNNLPEYYHE